MDDRSSAVTEKKAGRPAKPMPEPIDAPPEDVAAALMAAPPKRERDWRYKEQSAR